MVNEVDVKRLKGAIYCLNEMNYSNRPPKMILRSHIGLGTIREDDTWVDAVMSCDDPEKMLPLALWMFTADVKSGEYDSAEPLPAEVTP